MIAPSSDPCPERAPPTDLEQLTGQARARFAQAQTSADLENAKAQFLGKTSILSSLIKALALLEPEHKREQGARINVAKQAIEAALLARRQEISSAQLANALEAQALDVTLPGWGRGMGALHPVSLAWERIVTIFESMGFDVADGPEIETDWFNFTALGNPPNHPARSMQDTFYVDVLDEQGQPCCLRTHTSTMQIRYASAFARQLALQRPPMVGQGSAPSGGAPAQSLEPLKELRVIAPGRTYRVDNDATHSPMFHQFEGMWLGSSVSFKDLKVTYLNFCRAFFETDALQMRFRPSYFPFTEPSAEIDIMFESGPLAGKWLEVSGSGMTTPQVISNCGLDPERYQGFAFGSGIDRLAMLRFGVGDLRLFFEGDVRFLEQFR